MCAKGAVLLLHSTMPERFTEVTDFAQVARKGKYWVSFNASEWRLSHLPGLNPFGDSNGTTTHLAQRVNLPNGMARHTILAAIALFVFYYVISRVLTRKYIQKYGHAD